MCIYIYYIIYIYIILYYIYYIIYIYILDCIVYILYVYYIVLYIYYIILYYIILYYIILYDTKRRSSLPKRVHQPGSQFSMAWFKVAFCDAETLTTWDPTTTLFNPKKLYL